MVFGFETKGRSIEEIDSSLKSQTPAPVAVRHRQLVAPAWVGTPGWVVAWDDDARSPPLYRLSVSGRDHQPCPMALFPLPAWSPHGRELLAARGIILSPKTVRPWAGKFGRQFANQIRRRLPRAGDNGIRMSACSRSPG